MASMASTQEHETRDANEGWIPDDTFGCRLAMVRQGLGWNAKEAPIACGIGDQTWRNWEAGTSPHNFERVARQISSATGCSYEWLVAGAGSGTGSFLTPVELGYGQMTLPLGIVTPTLTAA